MRELKSNDWLWLVILGGATLLLGNAQAEYLDLVVSSVICTNTAAISNTAIVIDVTSNRSSIVVTRMTTTFTGAGVSGNIPGSIMQLFAAFILVMAMVTRAPAQQIAAPPLQLSPTAGRLSAAPRVIVRKFCFLGNTVFSEAELDKVVARYLDRELGREELDDARRAVTLYYIHHGYLNSGAILPDQPVNSGIVIMRIIEGRLTSVQLSGNHWLRSGYITNRIDRWDGPPLNVNELQEGLQLLRQNPNVEQINAELRPGATPGESVLDLKVKDEQPFRLGLQVDNARPPSVDSTEILLTAADLNLTGHSDPLNVIYGIAEGGERGFKFSDFNNMSGSYALPFTVYDTTLSLYGSQHDYAVVEEPFYVLNVNSTTTRYGAMLRQPFLQTSSREVAVSIAFDREHSESYLLGQPFDFPDSGSVSGRTDISVLRLSQEWTDRRLDQVVSLRSTFSIGIDAFGVTDDGSNRTAKFWAWLGQGQYTRRLWNTSNQLVLRAAGQWTDDELLPLEQFSVGGINSVRGYLENQLVRDRGLFASAELHLPVVCNKLGVPVIQLVPFYDFGGGWDVGGDPPKTVTTISSAGMGIQISLNKHCNAQLYWGYPFRKFAMPHDDPQDLGLSFRINFEAF